MADMAETTGTTQARRDGARSAGRRQVKVGRVVSNKMDKTVVVAVERPRPRTGSTTGR